MRAVRRASLSGFALAATSLAGATPALAQATSTPSTPPASEPAKTYQNYNFIDLNGSVGYSTNPDLSLDNHASAFGRISASGQHVSQSERGKTSIGGYLENTTYFTGGHGSHQIFWVNAEADRTLSETVTIYGGATVSGDFAGQLSNRLLFVPSQPPVIDPSNPLPPAPTNPDLLGLTGKQYRISGNVGSSIRTSARGSLSLSAGAERLMFSGSSAEDYNTYHASAGYNTQLSERTSVGGIVFLQYQDFKGDSHSTIINPTFDLRTDLRPNLVATARVGAMFIQQNREGITDHSVTPSFSVGLCSTGEMSSFCGNITRDAQSAVGSSFGVVGAGQTTVTTSGSLSYFRRIGPQDTIQVSLSGSNYTTPNSVDGQKIHSTLVSAVAGYDRKIGHRLAAGVSLAARRLFQDGPDPNSDLNGTIYVRYRIGDLL